MSDFKPVSGDPDTGLEVLFIQKIADLTAAHANGKNDAALRLGLTHRSHKAGSLTEAHGWLLRAGKQKNFSAIAAHRWLAVNYLKGIGARMCGKKAYLHNEIFFILYDRYWPAPDQERLHIENPKMRIYAEMKRAAGDEIASEEKLGIEQDAKRFCATFPLELEKPKLVIPDFLRVDACPSGIEFQTGYFCKGINTLTT